MQSVHKFLFETSFDQVRPAPKQAPAPTPPEPSYTAADLAAAREEAFAAGKDAGATEARAGIEQTAADTLSAIERSLSTLLDARAEAGRSFTRAAIETATAMVRKLYPALARRHGLAEEEGVLCQCLEGLRDEPRLVVRVADDLLDALGERLEPLTRSLGFGGRVILLADDSIAPGDCRIEWADGGVERSGPALWTDIDAAIDRALADHALADHPPSHEPKPQEDPREEDLATPDTTIDGKSEQP
jgi:flagellar assembly protein FliH